MKKEPWLKKLLMLTDKGYKDLKKAIVACTLSNFSLMLPFTVMVNMIIELIKPFQNEEISWVKMWILFGLGILAAFIVYLCNKNDYRKTYVTSYMESKSTRTTMAEHIRKLPMSFFNTKDLSDITTNLMGDVATIEQVLSHVIPQLFANAISVSVICICMAMFDWRMALAMFITVPVAFAVVVIARKIYANINKKHVDAKLKVSMQVQEYIEGIKVIHASNLDGEKFGVLKNALYKMKKLAVKMEFGTGVFVVGAQVILQLGVGLTVLTGAMLLTTGQINFLVMLMFILIVVRIYGPIITELTLLPELFYLQLSIKRMRRLMEVEVMEGDEKKALKQYDIAFDKVDFRYNKEGEKVIDSITTTIPQKSITALVGASGSGKSTISRLIARFWNVEKGRILIGGTDIKTLSPENLMGYMSFVFQDVVLFNDTVFNNIKIGNMNATDEEIYEAAKMACCDEFVSKMPNQYNTILGENGETLSGGERQRISIARALLKNAPIVLLDEATASLDPENESLIQEAISKLIQDKTVIVIAHRLRTIVNADKIIVLEKGKIAEEGTHEQLMKEKGTYHKMYQIQQESMQWSV